RSPAAYIGAIGSRKTQAKRRDRLKAAGFSDFAISRLHGPIGLDLGGGEPAETALAILAEMTAGGDGRKGEKGKVGKGGRKGRAANPYCPPLPLFSLSPAFVNYRTPASVRGLQRFAVPWLRAAAVRHRPR